MEPKEKQRIYAQTYIPSVEHFDDNPSLIQLASKAKDSKIPDTDDTTFHRRIPLAKGLLLNTTSKPPATNNKATEANNTVKLQHESTTGYFHKNGGHAEREHNMQRHDVVNKKASANYRDKRLIDSASPRFSQDVKHGSHVQEVKCNSSLSQALSPHREQRQVTSISACTWTPGSATPDVKDYKSSFEPQPRDHTSSTEPQTRTDTLSLPEDKLDSKDLKQSSRFFRSFPAQSGRTPMKLERNRGNQKLPVGIAVARQRQHAGPTKARTNATKNTSPDLDRRYLEHSLNQEREVLLRENKELSNYTSRLQTSSASSLPMLNLPNPMLPGAWEREQALMASSLLQWQAQQAQQSSLINSGLQHPSMWFGGTSPYQCQTGSSLPTGPTSLLPGGFVIMPQFLQENAMASMWPQLALYGNTHPASRNISNTFQDLISRQLVQNLQHHELQALQQQQQQQQQALLQPPGVSFQHRKSETPTTDEQRHSSTFTPKRRTENAQASPYQRFSASPKNLRRETPTNFSLDERRHRSPLQSPPSRTTSIQQQITNRDEGSTSERVKPQERNTVSTAEGHHGATPNQFQNRKIHSFDQRTSNTQVFDLTSSPEIFPTKLQSEVKNEKNTAILKRTGSIAFHDPNSVRKEEKYLSNDNNNDIEDLKVAENQPCTIVTSTVMQTIEKLPSSVDANLPCLKATVNIKNQVISTNLHDSSGVELLTKAADIHLKHMNANLNSMSVGEQTMPEKPPSDSSQSCENSECIAERIVENNTTYTTVAQNNAEIDISAVDPEVLDAVRGITLLSQSFSQNKQKNTDRIIVSDQHSQNNINDCNDDVQSTVSFSSITDSTIISGDCMSGCELKEQDNLFERVKLKRKLKRPISSTLKYCKEEDSTTGIGIKLDSMEAREVDMKSRLADLQRRYKEKQKELAKIQRRNKRDKHDSNTSTSSTAATPTTTAYSNNPILSSHHASPLEFKFPETTALTPSSQSNSKKNSFLKLPKNTVAEGIFSQKRKRSSDSDKEHPKTKQKSFPMKQNFEKDDTKSLFEKFQFIPLPNEKLDDETQNIKVRSEELENEISPDHQQIPSGSRKRKTDKPKRIFIPPGEKMTEPIVEPIKKTISSMVHLSEERKSEKKRKRKVKQASKKIKLEHDSANGNDPNMIYNSSWVFKSASKSEKHEKKQKKSESEKRKTDKSNKSHSANLSNNNNKRKKSRSVPKETTEIEPKPEVKIENNSLAPPRLELKEEDLVKGLQVLVPLEDKLLYLCQINPIQPPDIYEVTVEGERHRHRPIVMCLEQILKEAVPDVKPRSSHDLCEGARVAAYWSHKMHCLYTGTISFDDSDDEGEENREDMVQVEFDDGDSSTIPLEDIRLLPTNYPIMQPDAPFMMHYIHRRRTSEMSTKETSKITQAGKNKKGNNQVIDKKDKIEEKPRKKSEKSMKQKRSLDLSAYDYPSTDDIDQPLPVPRKRASPTKVNRKVGVTSKPTNNTDASSSAQSSSGDEDSDTVFSDSSDDTYDGDDGDSGTVSKKKEKRIPSKYHRNRPSMGNHSNELWTWYDNDLKKKEPAKGKARKIYHKSISRGNEIISCGDSAVFLSAGRPYLPYIGRIESMWESWGNNMVVKVRWFYHPEETKRGRLKSHGKHPLYKSSHIDENDVQTISHKCEVVSFKEYNRRMRNDEQNVFYCTGNYDPATGQVLQEHSDKRKHLKS